MRDTVINLHGIDYEGAMILNLTGEPHDEELKRFRLFSKLQKLDYHIYTITKCGDDYLNGKGCIHPERMYIIFDVIGWFLSPEEIPVEGEKEPISLEMSSEEIDYKEYFANEDIMHEEDPEKEKDGVLYDGVMDRNERFPTRKVKLFHEPYTFVIMRPTMNMLQERVNPHDLFEYLKMVIHPWWNVYLLYYGPFLEKVKPKIVCVARDRRDDTDDDHIAGIAITRYEIPEDQFVSWMHQTNDRDYIQQQKVKKSITQLNKEAREGGWSQNGKRKK